MDTNSVAKDRIYLKYNVLVVLFSFLFQLLKNLMHSEPDHGPGTAFIPVSGKAICSLVSDKRHQNWCWMFYFFLIGVVLEVQLRSDLPGRICKL